MKFKLDENLPVELVSDFVQIGHEAHTVFEEELTGAANRVILQAAHNEGHILLTLDKGIASIRDYPPELLSGIVLFRRRLRDAERSCTSFANAFPKFWS